MRVVICGFILRDINTVVCEVVDTKRHISHDMTENMEQHSTRQNY